MILSFPLSCGVTSLSGHPLKGQRRVRFVFVDESGSSAKEPVTVVAAIIVHGDHQWKPVANHLAGLVKDHVPLHLQKNFVLHAVDLFSGKALQEAWPPQKSWNLLEKVLQTVPEYMIPVSFGFCRKLTPVVESILPPDDLAYLNRGLERPGSRVKLQHARAMADCLTWADQFIERFCPDEVATVLVEDNPEMRKSIKAMPQLLEMISSLPIGNPGWIKPLRSIVGTVNYAGKREEPLLQLADACAFILRRRLGGFPHVDRFIHALHANDLIEQIENENGDAGGTVFARLKNDLAPFSKSG